MREGFGFEHKLVSFTSWIWIQVQYTIDHHHKHGSNFISGESKAIIIWFNLRQGKIWIRFGWISVDSQGSEALQ